MNIKQIFDEALKARLRLEREKWCAEVQQVRLLLNAMGDVIMELLDEDFRIWTVDAYVWSVDGLRMDWQSVVRLVQSRTGLDERQANLVAEAINIISDAEQISLIAREVDCEEVDLPGTITGGER